MYVRFKTAKPNLIVSIKQCAGFLSTKKCEIGKNFKKHKLAVII